MKNWKVYVSAYLMANIILTFITCGNDDEKKDICNCNPKAHLGIEENCSCGNIECNCLEQIITLNNSEIQVRKVIGISVIEMNEAVEFIIQDYEKWKNNLQNNNIFISGIIITKNNKEWKYNENNIIWMDINLIKSNTLDDLFAAIKDGHITPGMEGLIE